MGFRPVPKRGFTSSKYGTTTTEKVTCQTLNVMYLTFRCQMLFTHHFAKSDLYGATTVHLALWRRTVRGSTAILGAVEWITAGTAIGLRLVTVYTALWFLAFGVAMMFPAWAEYVANRLIAFHMAFRVLNWVAFYGTICRLTFGPAVLFARLSLTYPITFGRLEVVKRLPWRT